MIVVAYVPGLLRSETAEWAEQAGAHLEEIDPADGEGYWRALCLWWRAAGDLVVIEQDIVPSPGVVDEMAACPKEWCTSPFPVYEPGRAPVYIDHALGCARFSAGLRQRLPGAMIEADRPRGDSAPRGIWWMVDARLNGVLRGAGVAPHPHRPSRHLNGEPERARLGA